MESGRLGTARIAVLTILDEEFESVRTAFEATTHIPDSPYYTPDSERLDVVVRQIPDRANVPATSCASRMVEDFRPELVTVVGIGGGIEGRDNVAPGDVVVPSYLHYAEFRKLGRLGQLRRVTS